MPTALVPFPANCVAEYLNKCGRVEVIWFPSFSSWGQPPPPSYPWLHVWTKTDVRPTESTEVVGPYNYPFADTLPDFVVNLLGQILNGLPWLTPRFCDFFASTTRAGLKGETGGKNLTDLWGKSKDLLLYIRSTTLRQTANGYAILMKKEQVQMAIFDLTSKYRSMLEEYQSRFQWPINGPIEIRISGLDDPSKMGGKAECPIISSVSVDPETTKHGWDVALWFDLLTVISPDNIPTVFQFYTEFETWLYSKFGPQVRAEWSKGWAFTADQGGWTNQEIFKKIRASFTVGRNNENTWKHEVDTLNKYDTDKLFFDPLLETLFQ
jgi:hypothetical protein